MVIHVEAVKSLAPEDYMLIEEEHLRLHGSLNNLRTTCWNLHNHDGCESCSREKLATCQGRLVSFFYNMLYMSASHFSHEESIMLRQPHVTSEYEEFRIHQHAHGKMLREVNTIVSECTSLDAQSQTAEAYRQLYRRLSGLFEEHDRLFDDPFIQSVKP